MENRKYVIKHDVFDASGKKIGEKNIEYINNETDTHIYLTNKLISQIAKDMKKGNTFRSVYDAYEKKVMYQKDVDAPAFPVHSMYGKCDGKNAEITIEYKDGKKAEFIVPYKE